VAAGGVRNITADARTINVGPGGRRRRRAPVGAPLGLYNAVE